MYRSTNETIAFQHWALGHNQQPDNYGDAEDCVLMVPPNSEWHHGEGLWADWGCQNPIKFICEIELSY